MSNGDETVIDEDVLEDDLDHFEWTSPPAKRNRLLAGIEITESTLSIILMLVIFGSLIVQVVSRRFFEPVPWSDELVRYANIMLGFVGGALAMAANAHIKVDLIDRFLKPRAVRYLKAAASLLVAVCAIAVAWVSVPYVATMGARFSVAMHVPLIAMYGIAVAFIVVQAFHALIWVWEDLRARSDSPTGSEAARS